MPDGHRHVFSLRFFYASFILITILFSTACDKKNMDPNMFIGKTKQEVLEIIFKESPRLNDGSLNIMTVTSQRKYNNGSSALCAKNGKRIAGPPVQSSLNPA